MNSTGFEFNSKIRALPNQERLRLSQALTKQIKKAIETYVKAKQTQATFLPKKRTLVLKENPLRDFVIKSLKDTPLKINPLFSINGSSIVNNKEKESYPALDSLFCTLKMPNQARLIEMVSVLGVGVLLALVYTVFRRFSTLRLGLKLYQEYARQQKVKQLKQLAFDRYGI